MVGDRVARAIIAKARLLSWVLVDMRLVQVFDPGLGKRVGCVDHDVVYDLTAADPEHASSTLSLIRASRHRDLADLVDELLANAPRIRWMLSDLDVPPGPQAHLLAPVDAPEIWGAGLTYERSRDAREAESGHASFYTLAYEADRPELFLKTSNMLRVAGPNAPIGVRTDSSWTVPEPELAVVIGENGAIVGYTISNDVSARDIEGQNPLYLPQAKTFRGCCALGPALYVPRGSEDSSDWLIHLRIRDADGALLFTSEVPVRSMRRSPHYLVSYLCRDNEIGEGTILMTGTGIVPEDNFSLQPGQTVEIAVDQVGALRNPVLPTDDQAFGSLIDTTRISPA